MQRSRISIFVIMIILIHALVHPVISMASPPDISAPSGILIDAETGDILYEKNAFEAMYPASTTKIMTAILTLENTKLQDIVTIDKETPFTDGTRIYVIEGETFTVEQLLYALLVESANDAAVALAKHISGSVEEFAKLMNKRAKELGAKNTHFVNPNGLPNSEHVTTAYDLAMIAKYAMTLPLFPDIVKTVNYQIPPTDKQPETRYLRSSNRFLWGVGGSNKINYKGQWINIKYDIIEGIKTGYTIQAQQCLVTSAKKDGHRLISVVLKAQGTNIYTDTRTLIDYGFDNFSFIKLTDGSRSVKNVPIEDGQEATLELITQKELYKALPKDEATPQINESIEISKELRAPIHQGDIVGTLVFSSNGTALGTVNLIAAKTIEEREGITTIFFSEKSPGKSILKYLMILLLLYIGWRAYITWRRLKRKQLKASRRPIMVNNPGSPLFYRNDRSNRRKM
ncbi:D-alanyl-D-alanine carboxypeptidase (penicillin-binding protein 5/6) [Anaerosolibacter carboniphilus]|uniref:serine-type D-Ala-D-Ala carboxypeptidase n=1 Tax=Anaerosolibacter carboniphilus TaxID=1417629 RepID=A0A841KVA5_9FIRM|nr:D-alanyl-D-alanine carboxypeptidase family protein [Anaerosolibacter carboniphilus]MBB6214862.1 D-alanyl-D-alanine carboxypeptidase (penicillin-binding protein 5/6) [Anaerosolibacter carboniphilus]